MGNRFSSGPASTRLVVDLTKAPSYGAEAQDSANGPQLLSRMEEALQQARSFSPNPEPIRRAISNPSDEEATNTAVKALLGNVHIQNEWFHFSRVLFDVLRQLSDVCSGGSLAENEAAVALAIRMFAFIFEFDREKMMQSGIQNDFAAYRRLVGKVSDSSIEIEVDDQATGELNMFLAEMSPFTVKLANSVQLQGSSQDLMKYSKFIADITNCCCGMVISGALDTGKVGEKAVALHGMVSGIIIYDRIQSTGRTAFNTKEISIKKCISAIKKHGGAETDGLLNSVRYGAVNFQSASGSVQAMFP